MTNRLENILIGTLNWQHKSWQDTFYPAGMPEDWQLDYYSNQYLTVLVSPTIWQSWTEEMLEELVESLEDEEFYFVLQVNDLTEKNKMKLSLIKQFLGDLFFAVVLENITDENDFFNKKLAVAVTLKQSGNNTRVTGWSFAVGNNLFSGMPIIEVDLAVLSLAQQKIILADFEASLPSSTDGGIVFISNTDNNRIDANKLSDFKVLCELLGY